MLSASLCFSYLSYFGLSMPQCTNNHDFINLLKLIYQYLNTILLYINCYIFINLFIQVFERLRTFDIKMRYPDLKNGLFLIFAGWKVFLFVYCISIDLIYFLTVFRIFGVTVGCFFHLYLQRIMESYQELLYIFVVSLISDRVAILRTRINDGKIQNIQNISRVLRELKENFQLINTYFSMLLLIKLSNGFLTILLAVSGDWWCKERHP